MGFASALSRTLSIRYQCALTLSCYGRAANATLVMYRPPPAAEHNVRLRDMENPKVVHRALAAITVTAALGCAGLSLHLWDIGPIVVWSLFMAGLAVAFEIVTVIYGVTVWPLLLLIGHVFGRQSNTAPPTATSAEPSASDDRGRHTAEQDRTRSAGRGG
jgi:hypothetical protein